MKWWEWVFAVAMYTFGIVLPGLVVVLLILGVL